MYDVIQVDGTFSKVQSRHAVHTPRAPYTSINIKLGPPPKDFLLIIYECGFSIYS